MPVRSGQQKILKSMKKRAWNRNNIGQRHRKRWRPACCRFSIYRCPIYSIQYWYTATPRHRQRPHHLSYFLSLPRIHHHYLLFIRPRYPPHYPPIQSHPLLYKPPSNLPTWIKMTKFRRTGPSPVRPFLLIPVVLSTIKHPSERIQPP